MSQNPASSVFEPNTTQVPNFIFEMIPRLSEAELKVLMVIIRKTYGWHKESDKISAGQLESLTGLSYSAIKKARASLSAKGVKLIKYKGNGRAITEYCRPYPVPVEEPVESAGSPWGPPGGPGEDPQGGHKEALTKDTLNKRHLEQNLNEGSPLSLESLRDTRRDVTAIKSTFLSLRGRGGRWGAQQSKLASKLLKDFEPEHIIKNMEALHLEAMSRQGQFGWTFSMEKLDRKWDDIETIYQAERAEIKRKTDEYRRQLEAQEATA
jgi:phage replication O-like protein O